MSVISDWAAKEEATLQQIAAGIKALDDKIQALSSSAGALSPEDQAALDQIASESAALATTANTIPGA